MVPASQTVPLQAALMRCETDQIESVIDGFRCDPGAAQLPEMRAVLENIFDDSDLGEMQRRAVDLAQIKGDRVAAEIAQALAEKCPMTHHVYLRLLKEAEAITTLPDALALDFQLAIKMTARPDFAEGVRAVLIDRQMTLTGNPHGWQMSAGPWSMMFLPLPVCRSCVKASLTVDWRNDKAVIRRHPAALLFNGWLFRKVKCA